MAAPASLPLLSRLVSSSVSIANYAGQIIRDIMKHGELEIKEKESARDLQTAADRAANKCIVSSLLSHFPKLTVIGEEDDEGCQGGSLLGIDKVKPVDMNCPENLLGIKEEDLVVWVDPLDGTAEYTQGLLDHVTVLIGVAAEGKPIAGIIHQPYYNYQNPGAELGRTLWGVVGGSCGGMEFNKPPADSLIVTTTRSHSSSTVNDAISSVKPDEVLRVGGAGHKVMLLLEGKAHLYIFASPGCKKWDTCAPQAVLEALGGVMTDIHGDPIPYEKSVPFRNSTGVLATAPGLDLHKYCAMIPDHVKNNLKA